MRYIYHIYLLILSLFCLTNCMAMTDADLTEDAEKTTLVRVGDVAPDFTVELLSGTTVTLSQLQGNTIMLMFFDSTCPECNVQLSMLNDVLDLFEGKNFKLLAISRGESLSAMERLDSDNDYHFNIGLDIDKSIYSLYATRHVPRCFVIDPLGHIIATSVGYSAEDFDQLLDVIENNLK